MGIVPTPQSPVARLLASGIVQITTVITVVGFVLVVCFSLIWDEIHGLPLSSTTNTLLQFLLTFIGLVTGTHLGSTVSTAGTNQGITAVVNPASLTVDAIGRPNGLQDNIRTSQSSSMSGGPLVRSGASVSTDAPGTSDSVTDPGHAARGY